MGLYKLLTTTMNTIISFSELGNYLSYGIIVFHDFIIFFLLLVSTAVISGLNLNLKTNMTEVLPSKTPMNSINKNNKDEDNNDDAKKKIKKIVNVIGYSIICFCTVSFVVLLYMRLNPGSGPGPEQTGAPELSITDEHVFDKLHDMLNNATKKSTILLTTMNTRISFSEPGNYLSYGIIVFHDFLFFFITLIFFFVISIFIMVMQVHMIEQESGYLRHLQGNPLKRLILSKVGHFPFLEFVWTIIPSIILANLAIPSFILLYLQDTVAHPIYTIKAIGNQWFWTYETNDFPWEPKEFAFDSYMIHESELEPGELRLLEVDNYLVVPAKMEIRLLVTSRDVLHSFALPSVNVKIDAIPGRLNQYPLIFDLPGNYYGQCSELCGPNHGFMPINVYVQTY